MNFLPFENFYIITSLKPEQVQDCLQQVVEPNNGFSFKSLFSSSSGNYFSGNVINGVFEFKRVISYRNSFLPQIKGATEAWINGSRIHVTMRMHIAVIIFMCMWLGGVGLAGVGILLQSLSKGGFEPTAFIPFGMFLFGYVLSTGGFKYESSKARNKLVELLNGEIAQ